MVNVKSTRRILLAFALAFTPLLVAAADFDPAPAWPLCGRITESSPPGWQETNGCPAERFGNATYTDARLAYSYGPRLLASGGDRYDFHRGLDIPTPTGTPIFAVTDGIVQSAGPHSSYSDPMIRLRHYRPGFSSCSAGGGCYNSLYLHISGWVVAEDDVISKGQLIGYTGASGLTGWEHLHFEIRNAPSWDSSSSWSRDAINVLAVLPYEEDNNTSIDFDSVTTEAEDTIKAAITLRSNRYDLQSVSMTLYDEAMVAIPQAGNQPNGLGYYVNPAFYDLELTNFQYSHKNSSNFPWSSFQESGDNKCPYHGEHGGSYDAAIHMDRPHPENFQQGMFNGVRVVTSKYWHNDQYFLQLEFQALQGPAACVRAESVFASGDTATAEWGNCEGVVEPPDLQPPPAPSNLTASVSKTGKGKKAVRTVALSWLDNASSESSYHVERCTKQGKGRNQSCDYQEIAVLPADSIGFEENPGSGKFKYRVRARNAVGDSGYSNEVEL